MLRRECLLLVLALLYGSLRVVNAADPPANEIPIASTGKNVQDTYQAFKTKLASTKKDVCDPTVAEAFKKLFESVIESTVCRQAFQDAKKATGKAKVVTYTIAAVTCGSAAFANFDFFGEIGKQWKKYDECAPLTEAYSKFVSECDKADFIVFLENDKAVACFDKETKKPFIFFDLKKDVVRLPKPLPK